MSFVAETSILDTPPTAPPDWLFLVRFAYLRVELPNNLDFLRELSSAISGLVEENQSMSDTDELLRLAGQGSRTAVNQLFERYRPRLRRMLNVRLDTRLLARMDPSDVIQETLMDAHNRLGSYLEKREVPFYPWLRQIAWERLIDAHRHHIKAEKRSVLFEKPGTLSLPYESAVRLAQRIVADQTGPSRAAAKREMRIHVRESLERLPAVEREVLVLRFLEELSLRDTAAVLGVSEGAVSMRQLRAIVKLKAVLEKRHGQT